MKYVHKEFYDGDWTICGPITYSVTAKKSDGSSLPGAVIRYTKNSFAWDSTNKNVTLGFREIEVDMRSYTTTTFETEIIVTIHGALITNGYSGTHDESFKITIFDCTLEVQNVPTSADIYAYAGNTMTSSLSSDTWSTDPRCYPLTVSFYIEQPYGSGTWVSKGPTHTWVTSFTQNSLTSPFSYEVSFKEVYSPTMYSFKLMNHTINKGLKVNQQVDYWTIHFFSATPVNPIWTFPLSNSDDKNVFKFAKQDP